MATKIGTVGNDTIIGTKFADTLFGLGGNDTLRGLGGNDALVGGKGNDKLFGGLGNDTLIGEAGNDILNGGAGADRFVFTTGGGKDVVADFDVDQDILQIPKTAQIKNADDVIDHAKQVGNHVVIDLGGGTTIKLKNVDLDDLKDNPDSHFDVQ